MRKLDFRRKKLDRETLPSAVGEIPRGTLTEITGPASSGRTSLLYSLLAETSSRQEFCALIDAADTFDPANAAAAGVRLSQVLWVRCGGNVEHAIRATDCCQQKAEALAWSRLDLGNTPARKRCSAFRWRRGFACAMRWRTPQRISALIVMAQQHHTQSCPGMRVWNSAPGRALWLGELPGGILNGLEATGQCIRNHQAEARTFSIAR